MLPPDPPRIGFGELLDALPIKGLTKSAGSRNPGGVGVGTLVGDEAGVTVSTGRLCVSVAEGASLGIPVGVTGAGLGNVTLVQEAASNRRMQAQASRLTNLVTCCVRCLSFHIHSLFRREELFGCSGEHREAANFVFIEWDNGAHHAIKFIPYIIHTLYIRLIEKHSSSRQQWVRKRSKNKHKNLHSPNPPILDINPK